MGNALSTLRAELAAFVRDASDNKWTAAEKNTAINAAIQDAYPSWFTRTVADKLVVCETTLEYTLPAMQRLINVAIEDAVNYVTGTATGGSTSTLIDTSQSWTTNAYAGWHVTLYDGTGAGQYALVASNTATTLTLTTTGYSWTVAPDTTSYYCLKDISDQEHDYWRILAWRVDRETQPTKLYLTANYVAGMYIRLDYLTAPAQLASDSAETDVDKQYIVYKAASLLHLIRMQDGPGFEDKSNRELAQVYTGMAEDYRTRHGMPFPTLPLRTESEHAFHALPAEWPFGW